MFKSDDQERLRQQADQFNIPIFVAELRQSGDEFEILALNNSHEDHSGMIMEQVVNKPLSELLPVEQARAVNHRYATCINRGAPLRYREQLQMPRGNLIWDTALSHLPLPDGRDRIIGSAVIVQRQQRDNQDILAFEDIGYFAATSSMRLEQISSVLAAVEQGMIAPDRLIGSVGMLAGLCRTVDETMRELRSIAESRLSADTSKALVNDINPSGVPSEIEQAISALTKMASDLPSFSDFGETSAESELDTVRPWP